MASESETNNNMSAADILRGGLVSGNLSDPNDVDYYRTGSGRGFGLDAPNAFTIASGDALSISFDSPTNQSNKDTVAISVLDEKLFALNSVAESRGMADLEAPRLHSLSIDTSSFSTSNRFISISYSATDNLTGIDSVTFYWTDPTGVNINGGRTVFSEYDHKK